MNNRKLYAALFLISFFVFNAHGQSSKQSDKLPRLVVLPFTGSNEEEGETLARWLEGDMAKQGEGAFEVVARSQIKNIMKMRQYQQEGLTNPDTIIDIGNRANAQYIVSGQIQSLGNINLLITSIIDLSTLEQIAGKYEIYSEKREIPDLIPKMAEALTDASQKPKENIYQVFIQSFEIQAAVVKSRDAETIAQLLACELANSGIFAVLPRTKAIDEAVAELQKERTDGINPESITVMGKAINPEYLLGGIIAKYEDQKSFEVTMTRLNGMIVEKNERENYNSIEDGIEVMQKLAKLLTGSDFREQQRQQQQQLMALVAAARQRAQRAAGQASAAAAEAEAALSADNADAVIAASWEANNAVYDAKTAAREIQNAVASAPNDTSFKTAAAEAANYVQAAEKSAQIAKKASDKAAKQKTKSDSVENFFAGRFVSIGATAGSSFAAPWLIGTVKITFPFFKYVLLEGGCDFGFIHGYTQRDDIKYNSFYPFGHLGGFLPLGEYLILYAGAGYGFMTANYKTADEDNTLNAHALDLTGGIYLGKRHHYANLGYSFRSNFSANNHKVFAGYSYRF
jgi:hypothetical protein